MLVRERAARKSNGHPALALPSLFLVHIALTHTHTYDKARASGKRAPPPKTKCSSHKLATKLHESFTDFNIDVTLTDNTKPPHFVLPFTPPFALKI